MKVAQTIAKQLGRRALFMIGAKNLVAGEDRLGMKLGRNAGRWSHLSIVLNGLDLYDFTFYKFYNCKVIREKTVPNVYCDMMHQVIETETGLATSL
jgi:hypothetical protein